MRAGSEYLYYAVICVRNCFCSFLCIYCFLGYVEDILWYFFNDCVFVADLMPLRRCNGGMVMLCGIFPLLFG